MSHSFPVITPEEAAAYINNGDTVGFSGFTPAGSAKVVPKAIADRAIAEHEAGRPFQIGVMTGASTGPSLDGVLARANAVAWRTPYQSDPDLRRCINEGRVRFFDMHLSAMPQQVRYNFFGPVHCAVVEACDITDDGEIVPTSSVGASPTFCRCAEKIIVELNRSHPRALRGIHDIYEPADPPHRREIPIYKPSDRIGADCIKVDPRKIVGVVETEQTDETSGFDAPNEVTQRIGQNVANFLAGEIAAGRIPKTFLPIQSGVGNIANAVLGALGQHPDIPPFEMYTEVVQDSVIGLMEQGKVRFASTTALTLSREKMEEVYRRLDFYKERLVLRPQEISNHPEVVRRLGIVSINTAIEVDIFGNVNSTHVLGKSLMNGIGGSGDFTRNAFISIFTCPSTAKGGKISTIVPLVSHMDHSEHSVQVVVTEHGVADLRGKSPSERARLIAEQCADPSFRDELLGYFSRVRDGHTPQTLAAAFAMHQQFLRTGSMAGVDWESYYGAQ
ncbi:MAG: acetyl-CoA hydrolase/transferase family protein [Verrucomicrobia bacterium]|nr:MAG: acetyl-CoA hydrolase/transferase family protein [Verrucomicrobiota bacterium]